MPHHLKNQGADSRLPQRTRNFTHGVWNPIPLPGSRQENSPWNTWNPHQGSQRALPGEREVQKASGIWRRNLLFDMEQTLYWGSLGLPALISTGMKNPCFASEVHTTILKSVPLSLNLRLTKIFKFLMLLWVKHSAQHFVQLMTFYLWEITWYQDTIP